MDTKKIHTPRHAALATAVRVLIELQMLERMGRPSQMPQTSRQRMQAEVAKWEGTDDVYALGIMAPLSALS